MPTVADITLGDQVRVVNVGTETLVWRWNSRPYTIEPGADGYVPFELMKKECGDPRSAEHSASIRDDYNGLMIIPARKDEVNRLMAYHQSSTANVKFDSYVPGLTVLPPNISDNAPQVEVYTLSGVRITTVLDDPEGQTQVAARPTRDDSDFYKMALQQQSEQLVNQQKIIAVMAKRMGINPADLLGDVEIPEGLPSDEPPLTSTVKENPAMVYNPRTKKVAERKNLEADPTTFDGLPEDD